MIYDYIALLFFVVVAALFPLSIVLTSLMIRKRSPGNSVKNAPYESGEESIGKGRIVDTEYLPFMMLFLPMEVIAVLVLSWSAYAYSMPAVYRDGMAGIVVLSGILSLIGYMIAGER